MTTAIAPAPARALKPIEEVRSTLTRLEPELKKVLPDNIRPEHFTRVMMTAIQQNPSLIDADVDRNSLYSAGLKCAADGLIPDGREAALVPFKGKVQYMPMVAGILKKVRNSGELGSIAAHVVYEKDAFEWVMGDDEKIVHKAPPLGEERGKPIGAYMIATLKDNFKVREVMSFKEIEKSRAVSRAANGPAWSQWWDEQAKKTVIRRGSKRLPMSTDLQNVIEREDEDADLEKKEPAAPPAGAQPAAPPAPQASRMNAIVDTEVVAPAPAAAPKAAPPPPARPAAPPPAPAAADGGGDAQEPIDDSQVPI